MMKFEIAVAALERLKTLAENTHQSTALRIADEALSAISAAPEETPAKRDKCNRPGCRRVAMWLYIEKNWELCNDCANEMKIDLAKLDLLPQRNVAAPVETLADDAEMLKWATFEAKTEHVLWPHDYAADDVVEIVAELFDRHRRRKAGR